MGSLPHLRFPSSFGLCSGLLSILFAYSALVQLNDYDWYIWLPFYSLACLVCLAHGIQFSTVSRFFAYVGFIWGSLLFIKVVSEGCLRGKVFSWMEFVSLDMDKKLVREKFGSLLVCLSLWLELEASGGVLGKNGNSQSRLHAGFTRNVMRSGQEKGRDLSNFLYDGMFLLVSASICLCAIYFTGRK